MERFGPGKGSVTVYRWADLTGSSSRSRTSSMGYKRFRRKGRHFVFWIESKRSRNIPPKLKKSPLISEQGPSKSPVENTRRRFRVPCDRLRLSAARPGCLLPGVLSGWRRPPLWSAARRAGDPPPGSSERWLSSGTWRGRAQRSPEPEHLQQFQYPAAHPLRIE